jgi:hypothetical protein
MHRATSLSWFPDGDVLISVEMVVTFPTIG